MTKGKITPEAGTGEPGRYAPNDLISVIDLGTELGILKQSIFKILNRLGIQPAKRLGANSRGQIIAFITQEEARRVSEYVVPRRSSIGPNDQPSSGIAESLLNERGVFYLLALEPKSDPSRFKVGFAATLPDRLRQLRCSAPFAEVIATWPCKRLWERTAIDCAAEGCERLHTEVFRAASLEEVRAKCDRFFALMPRNAIPEKTRPVPPNTKHEAKLPEQPPIR